MVIMVFETKKVRSIFLYFTAYGIPFVIVTLSSAMYPNAMIRQRYCWPSKDKGLIWSVLGPVLLIIVVNLIIFIMTLNAAAKIDKINSTSLTCEGRKKNLKQRTKGMMSLTCLLGFTWATGFFSLSNQSFVAYLFVFLNGLQGFFLFLTQMIFNEPVRSKLFAIYKENIAKISTTTSSVQPSKDSDGKNTEKEKDKTKFAKNENFAVSTIEQQYPSPTAPPSLPIGDDLLQIRLTIIERRKKPQELQHPFSLNEDEI
ncbi:uncharacterized protein TNIN_360181 [Trichonephila inaurata madagascariensis]|uniref:G-protein coupled receptors family 2 profile 2 domain-containing protein n=1 Tax=Trichonephila inaurata madagascariensis TaxID=2747483 RepID=A0A8X6Y8F3_9ARAC|nr:uncharacterized protein TNIN_360181 [Trichonephila inaurata madagascariensis]